MSSVKLPLGMHEAYGETHFRIAEHVDEWPKEFAIITAYATTGDVFTFDVCENRILVRVRVWPEVHINLFVFSHYLPWRSLSG